VCNVMVVTNRGNDDPRSRVLFFEMFCIFQFPRTTFAAGATNSECLFSGEYSMMVSALVDV
jgi:hypothetical protein